MLRIMKTETSLPEENTSEGPSRLKDRSDFRALYFENDALVFVDQTKLPLSEVYISTDSVERIAGAIERLEIRGAPAIGVAAAYAAALSVKPASAPDRSFEEIRRRFNAAYSRLASTRPTAVNLFWALDKMKAAFENYAHSGSSLPVFEYLLEKAVEIHIDDIEKCRLIGVNGARLFAGRSTVLTHCNAGSLATGGQGTALGVIKEAHRQGLVEFVYADETRPLLQGSRLTAFELEKAGIPFAINTDSMAAVLMAEGKVDLVITGADRIAVNGDSANKIGTYNLAVLCSFHGIPFYIAAPVSTIDTKCLSGEDIKIEFRSKSEVCSINGQQITKSEYDVFSPSFDVTPAELISGIITDKGVFTYPFDFSRMNA